MAALPVRSCIDCAGRCCTTYVVPLTGDDVWAIVQAQRLAPAQFVQAELEEHASETGFLLRSIGQTYSLALQHRRPRRMVRVCIFLLQLRDGIQRCGIYGHRPLACQTYPMQLRSEGVVPREDMLCPQGSWAGLPPDDAGWAVRLQRQEESWQRYAGIVGVWNAAVRASPARSYTLDEYLTYLLNVYDHLAQAPDAYRSPSFNDYLRLLAAAGT
jgi:Fe-S-cluster containining protein